MIHLLSKIGIVTFLCYLTLSCGGGGSEATTPAAPTPPIIDKPVELPVDPFQNIPLQSTIKKVQPMTGIVLWDNHEVWNSSEKEAMSKAISLEFSYISINQIVTDKGVYNWTYLDNKLAKIAARNHQAIFRLYYAYPGRETTVPNYIKNLPSYNETVGESEGLTTSFPDWSHTELQRFTQEFHTKFSERYDNDNRIAFLQVGFGLWGEYHIYDGPNILGQTFPSKTYQKVFLAHLQKTYASLPWSISIDASNIQNTPFNDANVTNIPFGLFDDSFMHQAHSDYNESAWSFFNYNERYKSVPFGGEFSYVETTDQRNVLKPNSGAYGISYEEFAEKFHISYMIGNDTYTNGSNQEQPITRIKEASMASGYQFTITGFAANTTHTKVTIENTGIAPIYYDAFLVINGVRAEKSLKGLLPNTSETLSLETKVELPTVTIVSEHLLPNQTIEFNADL